jgi:hypothetical protein
MKHPLSAPIWIIALCMVAITNLKGCEFLTRIAEHAQQQAAKKQLERLLK